MRCCKSRKSAITPEEDPINPDKLLLGGGRPLVALHNKAGLSYSHFLSPLQCKTLLRPSQVSATSSALQAQHAEDTHLMQCSTRQSHGSHGTARMHAATAHRGVFGAIDVWSPFAFVDLVKGTRVQQRLQDAARSAYQGQHSRVSTAGSGSAQQGAECALIPGWTASWNLSKHQHADEATTLAHNGHMHKRMHASWAKLGSGPAVAAAAAL